MNREFSKGTRRRVAPIHVLLGFAFLSVAFGAAVPAMRSAEMEERSSAVIRLADRLQEACRRHRDDTDFLAIEVAAQEAGSEHAGASFHRLAMKQGYPNWNGPYLDHPLTLAENPFGGGIELRSDWSHVATLGFSMRREGFGQYLVLHGVPEGAARQIDERLDHSGVSEMIASVWDTQGRVAWVPAGGGRLLIDLEVEL